MVLHLLFFELFFYFFFFFHFLTPNYRVTWVAAFIPESRVPFLSKMLRTKFYMILLLCTRLICQMKWKRDFLKNFNLYQQISWNIVDSSEMFPYCFHQPLSQQLTRSLQFSVHPRYIQQSHHNYLGLDDRTQYHQIPIIISFAIKKKF